MIEAGHGVRIGNESNIDQELIRQGAEALVTPVNGRCDRAEDQSTMD